MSGSDNDVSQSYTSPFHYLDRRITKIEDTLFDKEGGLVLAVNTISAQLAACWFAAKVIGALGVSVCLLLLGNLIAILWRHS